MFTRVTIDGAALDSFQNVLFSIARFRELTGVYPTRITVVGHTISSAGALNDYIDSHYAGPSFDSRMKVFRWRTRLTTARQQRASCPTHILRTLGTCVAVAHRS